VITKKLLTSFCLLIPLSLLNCHSRTELSEIIIENNLIGLGEIRKGSFNDIKIRIENQSQNELRILGIETSCDCTVSGSRKSVIPKYGIDTLNILYEPQTLGTQIETITLSTNTDPPFNNIVITAEVIKE